MFPKQTKRMLVLLISLLAIDRLGFYETYLIVAFTNSINKGAGFSTVEAYSGWNCVPTKYG